MITIETYDDIINQQRIIYDAEKISWSTHYGEQGSGYGYLKFSLPRRAGYNYKDIGYGYDIRVRKYLTTILFDGQIREISETSEDSIDVTAMGHICVAGDDELLRHYCDTRLDMWVVESELQKGSYRPDLFSTGRNAVGLYAHVSNDKALTSGDYTEITYEFSPDETAERFKCDLTTILGSGTIFDGTVSSTDVPNGYIYYTNDSGEGNIDTSMYLYNSTQGLNGLISAIDTGLNRITLDPTSAASGWAASDELAVYGPLFYAQISSIASDVITYGGTIIGEGNLANGQTVANVTKKAAATIQSYSAVANTITVTNEDHITGWEDEDVLSVMAPYFEATFSSAATATITYSSPIGERVASTATGWALYNEDLDDYATVQSWTIGSNQVVVTDSADISGWSNGETLQIFTPFRVKVLDDNDVQLWPASDWREGAVFHDRESINVTTSGDPTAFIIRYECYISGSADESSFAQFTDLKAYSTQDDVTISMLAEDIISTLSVSGHGLSSSTDEVVSYPTAIEPMFFEFETPANALSWACKLGYSGNRLAWGIRLDEDKELFVETQDESTIEYVVRRGSENKITIGASLQESYQQVRGIYQDKLGEQQLTDWQLDADSYFNSRYRRKSVSLDNVDTDAEAVTAIAKFLDDYKGPKRSASYTVREVYSTSGIRIPAEDIQATGGIVMIQDWRSVETGTSGSDIRDEWTKEQVVIVEVDYDNRTARLTPASARSDFEKYMAELARISER